MSAKLNEHHIRSHGRLPFQTHHGTPLNHPRLLSTSTTPHTTRMPSKRKQKRGGRRRHTSTFTLESPLEAFFSTYYPQFEYDPTGSASHGFYRLCDESGWDRHDPERQAAHQDFKDALVQQFNDIYGTDEDDLGEWQKLCHVVDMDTIPDDLDACREAIRETHVNLVDLVDGHLPGHHVRVFDSERELSEYTRHTGKYFPKENAYAGGFLRFLLRHILDPET
ncbi:hypothetical protein OG21DRAFT_518669 [Imleria badia]|nr:hypothetical protein OG21DRAFT_518669 [Imleria badia]